MSLLTRRSFATGTAALALLPAAPALAGAASRAFSVMVGSTRIGTHTVAVQPAADGGTVATSVIDIAAKDPVGLFTLYRYALNCTETYDASGTLVSMEGQCDDDGDPHFVNVTRQGDALSVSGSSYTGPAPLASGVASYWRREALGRTPWISTQSGLLFAVSATPAQVSDAPAGATAYRVTDNGEYTVDIFYDSRGEWIGSGFDAKGWRITMVYESETGALQA